MYPTIYHALLDLFGLDWSWTKLLNSFGFFVALAFVAANYTLTLELKRKEREGLLKGEKAVCYPGCEDNLRGAEVSEERVMVSNQFITSRGAGTALEFGLKIVEIIKGKEESENIAKAIILKG